MSKLNLDNDSCLSLDVMRMYHQRKLGDKDMHHVERHLLDCELCSDVIEGLDVNDVPVITSIAEKVNGRIVSMMMPAPAPSFMKRFGWYFSIPLILLIGWFAYNKFSDEAPAKLAINTGPGQPTVSNNTPAPINNNQPAQEPVRTPQGVEKQLPVNENKTADRDLAKDQLEQPKSDEPVKAVEQLADNSSAKEPVEEEPVPVDEKPVVKPNPPAEDYGNLRIIDVKVISKITAPSGKKSSGSSNGQLGNKSGRSDDAVFMPDEMPQYYGGDSELKYWLVRNFNNPVKDKRELKGKTTSVIFNVSSKGKVSDVAIGKPLSPELDAELVRLIESMPQWKPAAKKGTIQCMLSVTFK
jgi:hypothetical protein